jgi:hypothetical protein
LVTTANTASAYRNHMLGPGSTNANAKPSGSADPSGSTSGGTTEAKNVNRMIVQTTYR